MFIFEKKNFFFVFSRCSNIDHCVSLRMPVELIQFDRGHKLLGPGDRGFLINLTKARWSDNACAEAIKLLQSFTQLYHEVKVTYFYKNMLVFPGFFF